MTESGFTSDQQSALVYRSSDRGNNWTNISANLPNAPANDLVVDPTDTRTLYLATDVGVWFSRNQGAGWAPLGAGLPLEVVSDLTLHDSSRRLFAFTHGRSAWSLDLSAMPTAIPPTALPPSLALSAPWPNPARFEVQDVARPAARVERGSDDLRCTWPTRRDDRARPARGRNARDRVGRTRSRAARARGPASTSRERRARARCAPGESFSRD